MKRENLDVVAKAHVELLGIQGVLQMIADDEARNPSSILGALEVDVLKGAADGLQGIIDDLGEVIA